MRRRTKWLLVFASCFVVAVLSIIEFKFRRPTGEGPAGPSVDRQVFDSTWSNRKVLLLGLGDSVTRGLGARSPAHSYFQRLSTTPDDEWDEMRGVALDTVLPNLSAINLALSGSTSPMHKDIIDEQLELQGDNVFGLVVMTTGGNDLIHSYGRQTPREGAMYGATVSEAKPWIDSFSMRLEEMISEVTSQFPGGCEIYLADIYDPTDGVGDGASIFLPPWPDGLQIHARYNATIVDTCQRHEHVHHVPLHQTFLGHGSHCRQFWRSTYDAEDPHYWFWDNIEDPNTRGYDAIRRVFLNTIAANTELRY